MKKILTLICLLFLFAFTPIRTTRITGTQGTFIAEYDSRTQTLYPDYENLAKRTMLHKIDSELVYNSEKLIEWFFLFNNVKPIVAKRGTFKIDDAGIVHLLK